LVVSFAPRALVFASSQYVDQRIRAPGRRAAYPIGIAVFAIRRVGAVFGHRRAGDHERRDLRSGDGSIVNAIGLVFAAMLLLDQQPSLVAARLGTSTFSACPPGETLPDSDHGVLALRTAGSGFAGPSDQTDAAAFKVPLWVARVDDVPRSLFPSARCSPSSAIRVT